MGLGIYTEKDSGTKISDSGARTSPLVIAIDGHRGGVKEMLLYLRADDAGTYIDITVQPVLASAGKDLIDDGADFNWKLKVQLAKPTVAEWAAISNANEIDFSDISNAADTYFPFWLRVAVPHDSEVNSYKHATLRISYT